MKIELGLSEVYVSEANPLRLREAKGQRLACRGGTLWITAEGDGSDIHLGLGESHIISGNGLVIVGSLEHGRVHLADQ